MANIQRPADFVDQKHTPEPDVLAKLGKAAIVAASIDDILHAIYWMHAKLSDSMGMVITRDLKSDRLANELIKIAEAANADAAILADLKDLLQQHKTLAEFRNRLIHWIWNESIGGQIELTPPSNKATQQAIMINLNILTTLVDDLVWLETRLETHAMSKTELMKARTKLGAKADLYAPAPWL